MRRILNVMYSHQNWRSLARFSGVALGINFAGYQYALSCEEDQQNPIEQLIPVSPQYVSSVQDSDIQILTKYSNLSDLIVHHRTESECIVILPNCSESTRQIILSNLQRKRDAKQIRVYVFNPPTQQVHLSAKDEKREQEKQRDVSQRIENVEFFGINSYGDLKFFTLSNNNLQNENNSYTNFRVSFQKALNFFYPPPIIRENDSQALIESIKNMSTETRFVICYIPEQKIYEANLPKISGFDSYRQGRIKNIPQLEKRFRDISYNYIEKNTKFILIRSFSVAQSLSIGQDDAGELYSLKRSSKFSNKESNFMFLGNEYIYNKMEWDPNTDTNQFLSDQEIKQKIYERATNYVQQIDVDTELRAFLSSQQEFGTKKLLIYYSAEALEKQYEDKVIKKLVSLKKNVNDPKFTIIFTKNPNLLTKFFGIIPEHHADTVRLFDYSTKKQDNSDTYLNWTVQQLNQNQTSQTHEQYLDDSTLYEKNARNVKRYKYDGKITRNKLTFFVKQALLNPQVESYEESDGTVISKPESSTYLNAANFEKEILSKNNDSNEISLVYFYKPGCPNCSAMSKSLEKFNSDLTTVQSGLNEHESQPRQSVSNDDSLLKLYNIKNHSRFQNLKIYRYNIYNESKGFPSPSAAPLVFIFTKNTRSKPIQADLLKDRVNINDSEKVSRYLFKKVDLLNV